MRDLRARQVRNFLATLFLSQGVPMLLAGDEFGHTQSGNNNAYCQDNELAWIDWSLPERNARPAALRAAPGGPAPLAAVAAPRYVPQGNAARAPRPRTSPGCIRRDGK